ncbi:MAG TPA: hypothetical protein DEB10_02250 [Ruminococcaceae bacterium]|nr:hypothetical protein [Oscillospiraceae bacterium]
MIVSATSQLFVQFPKYIILSDLSLLQIKYIPMALAIRNLFFSIFVLVKMFVKKPILVKIVGTILGISAVPLFFSTIAYFIQIQSAFSVLRPFELINVVLYVFVLLFYGVLILLICINTYKNFISQKSALMIALVVICLGLISTIFRNAAVPTELFKDRSHLINFFSHVITTPLWFLIYYTALKPDKNVLQSKMIEMNRQHGKPSIFEEEKQ